MDLPVTGHFHAPIPFIYLLLTPWSFLIKVTENVDDPVIRYNWLSFISVGNWSSIPVTHTTVLDKVKEKLQRMENSGVIEQVKQSTEWCAPVVPVLKRTHPESALKREHCILPILGWNNLAAIWCNCLLLPHCWQWVLINLSASRQLQIKDVHNTVWQGLLQDFTLHSRCNRDLPAKDARVLPGQHLFFGATIDKHDARLAVLKLNQEKCFLR